MSRKKRACNKPGRNRKQSVSITAAPWGGDHGTGTAMANAGTELVEVKDERGGNPNRIKRRQRVNRLEVMMRRDWLSMRQYQAGRYIQDAYGLVHSLSSGSPIKERVQSSPKPDRVVAMQVEAHSMLKRAMDHVLYSERAIIELVCWHNKPMAVLVRQGHARAPARLKAALNRVADALGY